MDHISLPVRLRHALRKTCKLHTPENDCTACDLRFAAVMEAFRPELDALAGADARLFHVIGERNDAIAKKSRYRRAWLSAKRGRRLWTEHYRNLLTTHLRSYPADKFVPRAIYNKTVLSVQKDSVRAWERVHSLEDELRDLRLAFSELQGAQAQEQDDALDDDDMCGANPPEEGPWGDCWCTLKKGHDGDCFCTPCTKRNDAPGWAHEEDCCATDT